MQPQAPHELSPEYQAGFFDGEGSVILSLNGAYHRLWARISMARTGASVLDALHAQWGGYRYDRESRALQANDTSEWYLVGPQCRPFLEAIRPHSRLKDLQIDLALKFLDTFPGASCPKKGLDPGVYRRREDLRLANRALNARGRPEPQEAAA